MKRGEFASTGPSVSRTGTKIRDVLRLASIGKTRDPFIPSDSLK